MKKIYYFPQWKSIIVGVILICMWILMLLIGIGIWDVKNIDDFIKHIPYLIPTFYGSIIIFLLQLFVTFAHWCMLVYGILFIKNSNKSILLEFNEKEIIYYKRKAFDGTRFKDRRLAPFYGYGYLKNKKTIKYDEVKQVNIECVDNIFKEPFKRPEFKIITKDEKTHLLPVAFPEKDKDEIMEYIKGKMK